MTNYETLWERGWFPCPQLHFKSGFPTLKRPRRMFCRNMASHSHPRNSPASCCANEECERNHERSSIPKYASRHGSNGPIAIHCSKWVKGCCHTSYASKVKAFVMAWAHICHERAREVARGSIRGQCMSSNPSNHLFSLVEMAVAKGRLCNPACRMQIKAS